MSSEQKGLAISLELFPDSEKDNEELDRAARQLLRESNELGLTGSLARREASVNTKSFEAIEVGKVLLAVLPTALPKLIDLVSNWLARPADRELLITLPDGTMLKLKGNLTDEQVRSILALSSQRN